MKCVPPSERCTKTFFYDSWHDTRCSRRAKRDGFCTQHHPDTVKKRDAATRERWARERAANDKRWALEAIRRDMADAVIARASPERLEQLRKKYEDANK